MKNNNEFKSVNELESLDDLGLEYNETFSVEGGLNMIENEFKYLFDNHNKWLNGVGGQKLSVNLLNMSNMELENENLAKANFENCDFSYTIFNNINFSESTFRKCNFKGAAFIHCKLNESRFIECNLNKSRFTCNTGTRLEIKSSKMIQSMFIFNHFESISIESCELHIVNFLSNFMRKSFLYDSEMHNTKISDSDLMESNINTCEFVNCEFYGVNLDYSTIKNNIMMENKFLLTSLNNINELEVYSIQVPIKDESPTIYNIPEWELWIFKNVCGQVIDLYKHLEGSYYTDEDKEKLENAVYVINNLKNSENQKKEVNKELSWE